ncbi:MAG TPA: hypothetical protein ENO00_10570 [Deltaproteobacteria bacterium]|nr:hypothetical protein [Deltaproteobacteria bacterium]
MQAFKIENHIIAADLIEDAMNLFKHEIGGYFPENVEEIDISDQIECDDGRIMTVKDVINETLDERQEWLRMGFQCEVYRPFLIKKLKD